MSNRLCKIGFGGMGVDEVLLEEADLPMRCAIPFARCCLWRLTDMSALVVRTSQITRSNGRLRNP
ncbi:hypothetical protein LMG28727_07724 [Paraburkholderia kirstenboschensis]|nr:hypothetical protein LMG28727_07724 [Paraburkholderia kirstenboschensis]